MDAVLKQLESRIEELIEEYHEATGREAELRAQVVELETKIDGLESKLSSESETNQRVLALETQRDELVIRLEKVLSLIDGVLTKKS
jgi:predicted  nucleic acid-binding Zn-ribbon protein